LARHLALEHLQGYLPDVTIQYWRDKAVREIDFVIARGRKEVDAIACKWSPAAFDGAALKVFRESYPKGRNFLVTPSGDPAYTTTFGKLRIRVCTPPEVTG
jgi:hypothetical protein